MMHRSSTALILAGLLLQAGIALAAPPTDWSWRYYRPTNTGILGDYCYAVWIDAEDTPYLGGFNPHWNEGGFSHFIESEKRWEAFSNVDYPLIGDVNVDGDVTISEICPAPDGTLLLLAGRAILHFDPALGAASLQRFDASNTPLPDGSFKDISVAPDGSIWVAVKNYYLGDPDGGLIRYDPRAEDWTVWNVNTHANGWPGWGKITKVIVQPLAGRDYAVWIEDDLYGRVVFESATGQFLEVPNNGQPGEIGSLIHNSADEVGNAWMFRELEGSMGWSLDYRRPDGTWVVPPAVYPAYYGLNVFRAFGDTQALLIGAGTELWHFDGHDWSSLGEWGGSVVGDAAMDSQGRVWVCGNGGAAVRDPESGVWQRYRVSNTSQIDMWVRDISLAPNGEVWMTGNTSPGVGGIGVFDGLRWHNYNVYTYGLGGDWPFPCDNADAICFRPSSGRTAFNPYNNGIREVEGDSFFTLETGSKSDGLAEDSFGRLWTIGNYFSLRYHDGSGFTDLSIAGWGANIVPDPDRPGTVWACANLEVVRTDGDYRYSRENVDLPELNAMHDTFMGVVADQDGVAWLGTTEGIFRLDAITGTHQWWHSSNSAMPGDQMQPLAVAPDGLVWFTNFKFNNEFEPALVWFDGEQFGTITRDDGLPHEQIYDAELRVVGNAYELWLSCASRGVAVLTVPQSNPRHVLEAPFPLAVSDHTSRSVEQGRVR